MKKVIKFCKMSLGTMCYLLAHLFPRDKKIVVYGCPRGSFYDNAKYFFYIASDHLTDYRHIWISPNGSLVAQLRQKGYAAHKMYSPKGLYYALRAKIYVYSYYSYDVNGFLSGGAFRFCLWHGVPFKKIERDIDTGPLRSIYNPKGVLEKLHSFISSPWFIRQPSKILVPSSNLSSIFTTAFQLEKEDQVVMAYPRTRLFYLPLDNVEEYIHKMETKAIAELLQTIKKYDKAIIYMPTWRDSSPYFIDEAIPDFEALNTICAEKSICFLMKLHPLSKIDRTQLANYSNIVIVDNDIKDIYPILPFTDALISDYSSIVFDYSLLNKKIIFYPFDKESYLSSDRGAYFDYDAMFGKNVATNFTSLLSEFEDLSADTSSRIGTFPQYILPYSEDEFVYQTRDLFSKI